MQDMPVEGKEKVFPKLIERLYNFGESGLALLPMIEERRKIGIETYGRELETFNGRNAKQDAIEEGIDQLVYLTQAVMENTSDEEKNRLHMAFSRAMQALEWLVKK